MIPCTILNTIINISRPIDSDIDPIIHKYNYNIGRNMDSERLNIQL